MTGTCLVDDGHEVVAEVEAHTDVVREVVVECIVEAIKMPKASAGRGAAPAGHASVPFPVS